MAFVAWLRHNHPEHHALLVHPKNEGVRTARQAAFDKSQGSLNKGASDLIILNQTPFVCELKKTGGRLSKEQKAFLTNAQDAGCFACAAWGLDGVKQAFSEWLKII